MLVDGWVRENAKKASIQLKIDEWVGEKDERKILFVGPIRHKKETSTSTTQCNLDNCRENMYGGRKGM